MIIEFIGPSGAGKTFIAQQLKNYLQDNLSELKQIILVDQELGTYYNSRIQRFLVWLRIVMNLYIDKNLITLLLLRTKSKGKKLFSMKYTLRMFVRYCKMADLSNKANNFVFIMDEGFMARSGHIFKHKPNADLEEYYVLIGKINAIRKVGYSILRKIFVFVRCEDFDEIIRRVIKRRKTSIYLRLPGDGKVFHKKELHSIELAREYLEQNCMDYIVIDNIIKRSDYTDDFKKIKALMEKSP